MRRCVYLFLMGVISLPVQQLRAQDKTQEKPKIEERAKPSTPIKVQVVLTEWDGDKKVASMPYTFMVIADEKMGRYTTSLRTGIRIPVEVDGKDQKTTYVDVGSNIDCGIQSEEDGRYRLYLAVERSGLYPNKSQEGERLVAEPNGQPLIHQFRTSENLILKDGQTSDGILSTDPLNGHTLRVSVTITVQK
jgi:hypothetical protein